MDPPGGLNYNLPRHGHTQEFVLALLSSLIVMYVINHINWFCSTLSPLFPLLFLAERRGCWVMLWESNGGFAVIVCLEFCHNRTHFIMAI